MHAQSDGSNSRYVSAFCDDVKVPTTFTRCRHIVVLSATQRFALVPKLRISPIVLQSKKSDDKVTYHRTQEKWPCPHIYEIDPRGLSWKCPRCRRMTPELLGHGDDGDLNVQ